MKKIKAEYIISGIFTAIIMFFMCAILVRFIGTKFFHISFENNNASENGEITAETNGMNWASLYPFSENIRFEYESAESEKNETVQKEWGMKDQIDLLESRVDYYSSNLLFGRMKFVEANAFFNRKVGMKIISGTDSVVVMNNGYLTFQSYNHDTEYAAASLEWFNEMLKEKNIDFMYVQFPSKESPYDKKLPVGVEDYNNENADSLLERLKNTDIIHSDFRELLNLHTDNWYGSFFRTDHHWTAETGVWAAGQLAKLLNQNFGYGISEGIADINNYNVKIYEDYCLGSQGKISTLRFTDPEDFSLITPKEKTDFTVNYFSEHSGTGSYDEVLIDKRAVEKIDYYNLSTYSAYLYGNNAVTSIRNNSIHNGKKLLLLSDSFCKCVVPVLAQEIEFIDIIDRRYFTGSVMSYIEQFGPDAVVVAYNPTMISSNSSHSGMFNFE